MPRPIDANELKKRAREKSEFIMHIGSPYDVECFIDDAPTLDYAPVRHGEWGAAEIVGYDGIHAVYAVPCSVCKEYAEIYHARYCPNCGALMDRKEEAHG